MAIMESVGYEVAIEILGQSLQPLISALADERQKAAPSQALVQYLEGRITSIEQLQDGLEADDRATINKILETSGALFPR